MKKTETPKPTGTYEISADGSVWSKSRFKIVNREDIPLDVYRDYLDTNGASTKFAQWNLKKYIILDTSTGKIRGMSDSHEWCFHKICMVEGKAKKGGNHE